MAKTEGTFTLKSKFKPTGDQPEAIAALYEGLKRGERRLVLQGVTGSGKTFTMANLEGLAWCQRGGLGSAKGRG